MSSYRGMDLFGSGPHRFVVRGVAQRTVSHASPGVDGERITPMGRSNRRIDQTGTLIGHDVASLEAQREAIELAMDGRPGELADDVGADARRGGDARVRRGARTPDRPEAGDGLPGALRAGADVNAATQDVFEMVLARWAEHGPRGLGHLVWRAPQQGDRLVQVYVDGALYDVSVTAEQREMWLHLETGRAHRIELLAVPAEEAWNDHGAELSGWLPSFTSTAELALLRDEALDIDGRVVVTVDGRLDCRDRMWCGGDWRGGFGALFGEGRFGHDDATAPGFALGELGAGAFGSDGSAWRWRRDGLPAGAHTIEVAVEDAAGRVIGELSSPVEVVVDGAPGAAKNLRMEPGFVLRWDV